MKSNYKSFVDRMIQVYEGGYGWDRGDAGGPTKYGITCFDLAAHRGQTMNSMSAWAPVVQAMELPEAEEIYAEKYAKGVAFDDLPTGVDCVMMDYGVNSGVGRANRVACKIVGLPGSAVMTPGLLTMIKNKDPKWFINTMCDERMIFLRSLSIWPLFKNGWTARVEDLRAYALAIANKKAKPADPPVVMPAVPKGTNVTPINTPANTGTIASGGAAGAAGFIGYGWVTVLAILVIGILGTLAYLYWRQRSQEKKDEVVVLPVPVPTTPQGGQDVR